MGVIKEFGEKLKEFGEKLKKRDHDIEILKFQIIELNYPGHERDEKFDRNEDEEKWKYYNEY